MLSESLTCEFQNSSQKFSTDMFPPHLPWLYMFQSNSASVEYLLAFYPRVTWRKSAGKVYRTINYNNAKLNLHLIIFIWHFQIHMKIVPDNYLFCGRSMCKISEFRMNFGMSTTCPRALHHYNTCSNLMNIPLTGLDMLHQTKIKLNWNKTAHAWNFGAASKQEGLSNV